MERAPHAVPDRGPAHASNDAAPLPGFAALPVSRRPIALWARVKGSALGAAMIWAVLSPATAFASWTLDFSVGGYCVEMEVGDDAGPKLGRVRFFPPGDPTGIPLRPQDIRVRAFDPVQRQLRLEYRATPGTPAFDLTVDGDRGVLDVEGEKLQAPFDWQM